MLRVSIAGASGYVGGELLRLLLRHPEVELAQVTSERRAGHYVHTTHPNLRGHTTLRFSPAATLERCDVLFLALPHGRAAREIERYAELGTRIVDCSADFRLRDADAYAQWYGAEHPNPEWLGRFVYGLPELEREAIRTARYVSGVGCNATATNLALLALARSELLDRSRPVVADLKVGSSEAGNEPNEGSHHPERAHAVRSFAPVGHRHTAEVGQALGLDVHLSVTSVELVRGALATCHAWLKQPVGDRELWPVYREALGGEPFVRIVHERGGIFRHPEPKLLAGTNYADVGWSVDEQSGRVVALAAIDNLGKGAAGTAVQCMNLMHSIDETLGLDAIGLHPI